MSARLMKLGFLLAVAMTTQAAAAGLAIDGATLSNGAELRAQIAAARSSHAEAFAAVAQVKSDADALFAKRRGGRVAPMGRTFKQLGPEALWPMLDLLAFDLGSGAPSTEGGRLSLAVGLLDAVGARQDGRSAAVLEAIVSLETAHPLVTAEAARAYGFLQTDRVAARLVDLARKSGAHARAVREGMGSCRRIVVAQLLADALAASTDVREQIELSRALADVGNAWAWQTPGVTARSEERDVKLIAARALVQSYVERTGDARQAASNAVLVVGSHDTLALVAAAMRRATPEQHTALAELKARFERNPVR